MTAEQLLTKVKLGLSRLSGTNFAHTLVLALVGKAIISDVSPSAMLITVPVLGYEAYKLYLKSKKPEPAQIQEEVKKELELVKSKLSALTMDKNVVPQKTRYF